MSIGYTFLEEDVAPPPIKHVPKSIQQETECTIILFMFIGALILMGLIQEKRHG